MQAGARLLAYLAGRYLDVAPRREPPVGTSLTARPAKCFPLFFAFLGLLAACGAADPPAQDTRDAQAQVIPGWESITEFLGEPVDTIVQHHPLDAGGRVRRIVCVKRGVEPPQNEHGPEWVAWPNGHPKFQKIWVDGSQHGPYREWSEGGILIVEGAYADGVRDGVRQEFWAADGAVRARKEYRDGKPHGAFVEHYPSGAPKSESRWENGLQSGVERQWTPEGALVSEAHYRADLLHGAWKRNFPNGDPRIAGAHEDGLKSGVWTEWRADGSKVSEQSFVAGEPDGPHVAWYANGQKQLEGNLEDGLREGPWTYWREDGTVQDKWSGRYVNDELVTDD